MHKLKYHGIKLPDIYVCEKKEAEHAREMGVPFLVKPRSWTDEDVIKRILYNWLRRRFPHLELAKPKDSAIVIEVPAAYRGDFGDGLGHYDSGTPEYVLVTEDAEYRESGGGLEEDIDLMRYEEVKFDEFFDPTEITVDIEVLQRLKMLPVFLDDIQAAIKQNLMNVAWQDGWNKKLGMPTGSFQGGSQAPNLIILDVSGSIPNGIASTMVSLIETLRTQADADLIVTSGSSHWYPKDKPCPTPEQLSHLVGGGNESWQFYRILNEHVLGRHWGNVIVFGDQDCPVDCKTVDPRMAERIGGELLDKRAMSATKVDNLLSFHTYSTRKTPGYGKWCHDCQLGNETIDCSWVKGMRLSKYQRDNLDRKKRFYDA